MPQDQKLEMLPSNTQLRAQIDALRQSVHSDWTGSSSKKSTLEAQKYLNESLETRIRILMDLLPQLKTIENAPQRRLVSKR